MRKSMIAFMLLVMLFDVYGAVYAFDIRKGESAVLPGAGQVCEGYQLLAELERPVVAVGEKVNLKLTLQNVSEQDRKFVSSNPRTEFQLTITDDKGRGVPGNSNLYGGAIINSHIFVIKPGYQVLENYCVNSVFDDDIRKPGRYHITARTYLINEKNSSTPPVVVSNTVILTVVKSDSKPKGDNR